ncbi:MAG: hypothetical protein JWR38_2141 [Mucilaginibacter sp.]|nr:hypothetical protein [Mucilaginibacter sp.]
MYAFILSNILVCHCEEERRSNRKPGIFALYSMRLPRFARNDICFLYPQRFTIKRVIRA